MKGIRTWKYLTLLAVVGFWGCSPEATKNLADNDDLYGSAPDAVAYATPQKARKLYDNQPSKRYQRNSNPDFVADDQATAYNDEYYSDLSARKVTTRGISADPGWSNDSYNSYNNGFWSGYNSALMSSRWNTWGWNNPFMGGMGLGLGMSFGSPWGWGGYSPFFSPFNSFGSYAYSPFYSPYSYYGGFNDPFFYGGGGFYNPYYSYGGFYNRPTYVINNYGSNIGASRPVNYGARNGSSYSRDRYNGDFVNTPRSYNGNNGSGARRSGELNSSNNVANTPANGNAYYNRPSSRQNSAHSGNNSNYYYNGNANVANGRSSANPYVSTPRASSGGDYYAAPRQNSRGSYTPPSDNSYRYSSPQQSQSYQAPTYRSNQNSGFERSNSFSSPRPTQSYSPPSQSFGGGSRGGSVGGGGFSGGGGGGGGSRGPR